VSHTWTRLSTLATRSLLAAAIAAAVTARPVYARPGERAGEIPSLIAASDAGDLNAFEVASQTAKLEVRDLVEARLAAARFDEAAADRRLRSYFARRDKDAARQVMGWTIAADVGFARGDYGEAAKASAELLRRLPAVDPRRREAAQAEGVARALSKAPQQAVVDFDPVVISTLRDQAGLMKAATEINGQSQSAILDTGANLSTLSASAAQRLHVRMLDGDGSIGSSTRKQVSVRLGVADQVRIAGVTLTNVAFLVLDDAALKLPLPGGYQIDAIIGFPVLRAMRRVRFDADGHFGPELLGVGPIASGAPLRVIGADLFVNAKLGGIDTPLHLDTGAPESSLSAKFAARHPELLIGLKQSKVRTAGAGGATEQDVAVWESVSIDIGGRTTTLPRLDIATTTSPDVATERFGVLGGDVLSRFCSYSLDFSRATFEVGPSKAGGACARRP
jgi:hypothetical protein